jgi:RNA polymerase sigma factor (sigma-70 family)
MEVHSGKVLSKLSSGLPKGGRGYASLTDASDDEIWLAFKQGNADAFEFIYVRYFPLLFNYGRQFSSDTELVKDIIQDLFIYLNEKRSGLGNVSSIKFYLYKAFRSRIVRHFGKTQSLFRDVDDFSENGFGIVFAEEVAENPLLDEMLHKKLEAAFLTLTKRQREIVIYHFYEGFSYIEITSLMGFGRVEYARILMGRTILKLRKELADAGIAMELVLMLIAFQN